MKMRYKPIKSRSKTRANIEKYSLLYEEDYIWYQSTDICTIRDRSHYYDRGICNSKNIASINYSKQYINREAIHYKDRHIPHLSIKLK